MQTPSGGFKKNVQFVNVKKILIQTCSKRFLKIRQDQTNIYVF